MKHEYDVICYQISKTFVEIPKTQRPTVQPKCKYTEKYLPFVNHMYLLNGRYHEWALKSRGLSAHKTLSVSSCLLRSQASSQKLALLICKNPLDLAKTPGNNVCERFKSEEFKRFEPG